MKIEFYHCLAYLKKELNLTGDKLPFSTALGSSVIKGSLSDITLSSAIDNEIYVQEANEFSATVRFDDTLAQWLFTKPYHYKFPELSMVVIVVYDDSDNVIFSGVIKYDGNTTDSSSNSISFTAFDFLIFFGNDEAVDQNYSFFPLAYIESYIEGWNTDRTIYFKVDENGQAITLTLDSSLFTAVMPATLPEPLAVLTGADIPSSYIYMYAYKGKDINNLDPFVPTITTWNGHAKTFSIDSAGDLYLHVLLGRLNNGAQTQCEYFKFRLYNNTEFELMAPYMAPYNDGLVISYNYSDLAGLEQALLDYFADTGHSEIDELVTTIDYLGLRYNAGVVFMDNPTSDGKFYLQCTSTNPTATGYNTPLIGRIKTKNEDLLAKALFLTNLGISVVNRTFTVAHKSDYQPDYDDYTTVYMSSVLSWNLITKDKTTMEKDVISDLVGINRIPADPYTPNALPDPNNDNSLWINYWLSVRYESIFDIIHATIEFTARDLDLTLASIIMFDGFFAPIKFRISSVGYNQENPGLQNITAYNITSGIRPVVTISLNGNNIVMTADIVDADIYYTISTDEETDPEDPTIESTAYTVPLEMTTPYCMVKAICKDKGILSLIAEYTYIV